jgi:hypothetical protein
MLRVLSEQRAVRQLLLLYICVHTAAHAWDYEVAVVFMILVTFSWYGDSAVAAGVESFACSG